MRRGELRSVAFAAESQLDAREHIPKKKIAKAAVETGDREILHHDGGWGTIC